MDDKDLQHCNEVLTYMFNQAEAVNFSEPVNWKSLNLPDYPRIIRHPMDLGTIQKNLEKGKYDSIRKFLADVRLTFANSKAYNLPNSVIWNMADRLSVLFEKKFAKRKKRKLDEFIIDESKNLVESGDKAKFFNIIQNLNCDQLSQYIEIIETKCPQALQDRNSEIDIILDKIPASILHSLISYAQKNFDQK